MNSQTDFCLQPAYLTSASTVVHLALQLVHRLSGYGNMFTERITSRNRRPLIETFKVNVQDLVPFGRLNVK